LCHIFVTHTSASLIITGNEDANLLLDVEGYFQDTIADANPKHLKYSQSPNHHYLVIGVNAPNLDVHWLSNVYPWTGG
jgi:thiamine phosphate synthase YjbQ (UPF0047 family)